ncbi:MAG: hypothetical protein LBP56_10090 [Odoribacteraceae bacterium]|nr:hypothetical protein [Odoribacteraceae bacterium]
MKTNRLPARRPPGGVSRREKGRRARAPFSLFPLPAFVVACGLLFAGCATWYQRSAAFHSAVYAGDFEAASRALDKSKSQARKKNRILYYMNKGYVEFTRGRARESNEALETAERLAEAYRREALNEAAAIVSNPEARPYRPEDFEVIMINFYKAMNYLRLPDMEGALVEARKINIKLNALNDKYPDHKNRYQRDAFAHLLMGLIYDAAGDDNNAFIAYRNAYEVYRSDYTALFGIPAPRQLQRDLLRSAYRNGFTVELQEYEREFGLKYTPPATSDGELLFFWLNGFGPVKEEQSLHFILQPRGGSVVFYNEALGLSFPFAWSGSAAHPGVLSVAFPRYAERPPAYVSGHVATATGETYPLEIVENINEIALKTLHDRMLREFSTTLLRLAVKKSAEHVARKQNEWAGLAVSILNSATEHADTRNWQTLPYAIFYARVPLPAGDNEITLQCVPRAGLPAVERLRLTGDGRGTRFYLFQTMK